MRNTVEKSYGNRWHSACFAAVFFVFGIVITLFFLGSDDRVVASPDMNDTRQQTLSTSDTAPSRIPVVTNEEYSEHNQSVAEHHQPTHETENRQDDAAVRTNASAERLYVIDARLSELDGHDGSNTDRLVARMQAADVLIDRADTRLADDAAVIQNAPKAGSGNTQLDRLTAQHEAYRTRLQQLKEQRP